MMEEKPMALTGVRDVEGCCADVRSLMRRLGVDDAGGMAFLAGAMLDRRFGGSSADRMLVRGLAWMRGGAKAMLDAGTPRFDLMDDDTVDHVMAEDGGFGRRRDCDVAVWGSLKRSLAALSYPPASAAVRAGEIVASDPGMVSCVPDTVDGRYETMAVHDGMTGVHAVAYPVYGHGVTIRVDVLVDDPDVERFHETASCYLDMGQGFGADHELICGASRELSSDGLHDDRRLMMARIMDMLSEADSYVKGDYGR